MSVAAEVQGLLAAIFPDEIDRLDDDTPFATLASWDSLKHVELVVAVQGRFGLDLEADEIARLESPRAVRDVITARRGP